MAQCCCRWGAAVKDEWPEFECNRCEIHGGTGSLMSASDELCKRHDLEVNKELSLWLIIE